MKVREYFTITEKALVRAFSWLKAVTSAFTFKTLLKDTMLNRRYTIVSTMKLGCKDLGLLSTDIYSPLSVMILLLAHQFVKSS